MYIHRPRNAEALRDRFVPRKERKALELHISGENSNKARALDLTSFAQMMTKETQEHILDKDMKEWATPEFSTTTINDLVVASVAFVGAMSHYFNFESYDGCDLPAVTLLWVELAAPR